MAEEKPEEKTAPTFAVRPIGLDLKSDGHTLIDLGKNRQLGLLGLEPWSPVQFIGWFDKNDTPARRAIIQVHRRGDQVNPLTGFFACRSPFRPNLRPNLIVLNLCKVVVKESAVETEKMDAFDGTPELDLKPFAPRQDSATDVRVPDWTKPK